LLPVVVQGQAAPAMTLQQRMAYWRVPGVSVALINHGAIEWTRAYGVTDAGGQQAVLLNAVSGRLGEQTSDGGAGHAVGGGRQAKSR
jgi:hypothetical protein